MIKQSPTAATNSNCVCSPKPRIPSRSTSRQTCATASFSSSVSLIAAFAKMSYTPPDIAIRPNSLLASLYSASDIMAIVLPPFYKPPAPRNVGHGIGIGRPDTRYGQLIMVRAQDAPTRTLCAISGTLLTFHLGDSFLDHKF